ncbi:3-hydroxyacyl-CoA dehydrogenase [Oceanobacillus longus]|uniref:3-hydroxyacyl-CoA dehydrogenase n=1 Tax=Oceanobacillus longus TaxID=930120 RepID=A0ABV8GZF4_9BACI
MKHITVIGSGLMGTGIAHVSAQAGYQVTLYDINEEQLQCARQTIEKNLDKGIEIKKISEEVKWRALSNLHLTTDLSEAVQHTDFVIEAVPEILELKIDIFKKLDKLCRESVILATNTSTMSPTEIGAATNRPHRTIAMHFFNPVYKMKLVEIIKGLETSDKTLEVTKQVAKKMGKETVTVNEFPGFVTSRMNCVIGNEAMNMLSEGVASAEDIDKAIKLGLNHPMGPLELADLVGLDTRLKNMKYLHKTLGEKYRPSPILTKYVKAGRLGSKSGQGFYNY